MGHPIGRLRRPCGRRCIPRRFDYETLCWSRHRSGFRGYRFGCIRTNSPAYASRAPKPDSRAVAAASATAGHQRTSAWGRGPVAQDVQPAAARHIWRPVYQLSAPRRRLRDEWTAIELLRDGLREFEMTTA